MRGEASEVRVVALATRSWVGVGKERKVGREMDEDGADLGKGVA